jgi:hypothetical protein
MANLEGLSVWAFGDDYVDFVAAKTLDEAITHYSNATGVTRKEIEDNEVREVGWETMVYDAEDIVGTKEDGKPIYRGYTLRELALEQEAFPAIIVQTGDY